MSGNCTPDDIYAIIDARLSQRGATRLLNDIGNFINHLSIADTDNTSAACKLIACMDTPDRTLLKEFIEWSVHPRNGFLAPSVSIKPLPVRLQKHVLNVMQSMNRELSAGYWDVDKVTAATSQLLEKYVSSLQNDRLPAKPVYADAALKKRAEALCKILEQQQPGRLTGADLSAVAYLAVMQETVPSANVLKLDMRNARRDVAAHRHFPFDDDFNFFRRQLIRSYAEGKNTKGKSNTEIANEPVAGRAEQRVSQTGSAASILR